MNIAMKSSLGINRQTITQYSCYDREHNVNELLTSDSVYINNIQRNIILTCTQSNLYKAQHNQYIIPCTYFRQAESYRHWTGSRTAPKTPTEQTTKLNRPLWRRVIHPAHSRLPSSTGEQPPRAGRSPRNPPTSTADDRTRRRSNTY
jgi:hypothetical protein